MESITLGEILGWLGLIAGAITSVSVIFKAAKTVRDKRRDQIISQVEAVVEKEFAKIYARMDSSDARLAQLQKSLELNNLETARVDLVQAIEHAPHEHQAILAQAERYFIELGGDAWMSGIFREWAEREKVDISHISAMVAHL